MELGLHVTGWCLEGSRWKLSAAAGSPPRVLSESATPPQFRCWITRRISPNMAVISLKCSSTPWACALAKGIMEGSYHFGFTPGNFLQLTFPSTTDFPADSSHFAFALYILSASGGRGRPGYSRVVWFQWFLAGKRSIPKDYYPLEV